MARSKWLLLAVLILLVLSACGDNISVVSVTTPSPGSSNFVTTASAEIVGDPVPEYYYYVAETADSGDSWNLLMNKQDRSGKKTTNSVTLNCVALKTCFNLNNVADATSTKYYELMREGSKSWKYFPDINMSGGDVSCISRTECWRLFNDGSKGEVSSTKDGGATWTNLTRTGSLKVSEANKPLYLNSRRNDKIESEFAFIHAISCLNASRCVTVGEGRSFRTVDGGQTWDWFPTDGSWRFTDLICFDELTCYGFSPDFIAVTHDFGGSWQSFNLPGKESYPSFRGNSCPNVSFCVVGGDRGYFLTTNDKGTTWLKQSLPNDKILEDVSCPDDTTCYATISDQSLLITHDSGKTWTPKPVKLENFDGYNSRISCPTTTNCLISYTKLDYN